MAYGVWEVVGTGELLVGPRMTGLLLLGPDAAGVKDVGSGALGCDKPGNFGNIPPMMEDKSKADFAGFLVSSSSSSAVELLFRAPPKNLLLK